MEHGDIDKVFESLSSIISNVFDQSSDANSNNNNPVIEKILLLWLKHNIPMNAFDQLMNILHGIPLNEYKQFISSTNTNFGKCMNEAITANDIIFYVKCVKCDGLQAKRIDEPKQLCLKCNSVLEENSYFVYIGFLPQLMAKINNHFDEILNFRYEITQRYDKNPGSISDVWDGSHLKEIVKSNMNDIILSLSLNTDGASIYKSTQTSVWPILLHQNYLKPETRYKNENILLVGLYIGKKAPDMNTYFYPFINEFRQIQKSKIELTREGKNYVFQPVISHCIVDLQAKSKLQGIKPHNSHILFAWWKIGKTSQRKRQYDTICC